MFWDLGGWEPLCPRRAGSPARIHWIPDATISFAALVGLARGVRNVSRGHPDAEDAAALLSLSYELPARCHEQYQHAQNHQGHTVRWALHPIPLHTGPPCSNQPILPHAAWAFVRKPRGAHGPLLHHAWSPQQ